MTSRTACERERRGELERKLHEIGPSEAVTRLINKYGSLSTQKNYAIAIVLYLRWLKERDVQLTPDELVKDNLVCVFKSDPTDVGTKRKHTDWLDQFVNGHMLEKGYSESERRLVAAAINQLYRRNDSPLFGDFEVSKQPPREPPKPLRAEDIRAVLKALPVNIRTPLLCVWQSGVEINRTLSFTWRKMGGLDGSEYPLRLEFPGRKRHRRHYSTFLGRDSIEHLKILRSKWSDYAGRDPVPDDLVFIGKRSASLDMAWLNQILKRS